MKKLCTVFIITLLLCGRISSFAQADFKSTSNRGTNFWVSFPVCYAFADGQSGLKIYVSSGEKTKVTVEIPRFGIKFVKNSVPNGVIEFDLSPGQGQPYEKDPYPSDSFPEQVYSGAGVHIYSETPVSVTCASRFTATSDSFLALPVATLGKEYIVASYADMTGFGPFASLYLPSQTNIVAAFDNTVVTFKLGGMPGTKTVGGMKIGEVKTFKMMKGDVIAFANKKINGVYGDLSGSKITASKPVAVISGNQCAYVPEDTQACDFLMEMELPTNTWGKEYHITRMKDRLKYSMIKIFAKEPNTKIYRDDAVSPFIIITNAGGTEGSGYIKMRAGEDGSAPRPVAIRADKPISITQYNTGSVDDSKNGDPFQMVLTPVEQYQKELTFSTPGIAGGKGFSQNNLNIVFEANTDGTVPDDLEIAAVENGKFVWKPLKTVYGSTAEPFKKFVGSAKNYSAKIIALPGDGVYKLRALKPIAAYQYGSDYYDSYGHPVALSLKDFTINDIDKPLPTYNQDCNGQAIGVVKEKPENIETRSNLGLITLLEGSYNYKLSQDEFVPGDAVTVSWGLTVVDPTQKATAIVYFSDRVGNDTAITINYAPPTIALEQNELNFGLVIKNEKKVMQLVVKNTSGTESQTITSISFKNAQSKFTIVPAASLPYTLLPGASKSFDVQFTSATEGSFKDTVEVGINNCDIKFSATLVAQSGEAIIAVTDAAFEAEVNTSDTKAITVRNTSSTMDLVLTGVTVPSASEFTLSGNGWNISESNPLTLTPGNSIDLAVSFTSPVAGTYIDTIIFKSNAVQTKNYAVLYAIAIVPLGIEETENSSFSISPNPVTGFATITLPAFKSQAVFLKVFDAAGNEVADFSNNLLKTELRFDTKTLPNGAYFLRFTDGKITLSRSFIIQN